MFKVYIEESAFTDPQPMEVSPDAPVSKLVPALIDELQLPRTDLFGNRLVYYLRHTEDGRVLPEHFSLRTAGVGQEDCLALESYVAEGVSMLATPSKQVAGQNPSFYADQTIADVSSFANVGDSARSAPSTQQAFSPGARPLVTPVRGRRWTRRTLLMMGGATLGVAGIGLAYAGLHAFSGNPGAFPTQTRATAPVQATASRKATTSAQAFIPTRATAQLVFKQHQQLVRTVAWSSNGAMLASGASDRQLLTWNPNGQVQLNIKQDSTVHAVAWSPGNHHLAVAVGTHVLFYNAQSGKVEADAMHTHHGTVMALAWSPQQPQYLVSAGLDRLAVIWNTQTFQPQTIFRQHTSEILSAGWAPDGQTVGSCSLGGVIRVWNGANGQQVHGFYLDRAVAMNALAFEPGGTMLAVGGMDGVLRLWQSGLTCQLMGNGNAQGQCLDKPMHLMGHTQAIRALGWSPDGRLLASAGDDNTVLIWNPAQSQKPLLKIQQDTNILALSWSPDGKQIATAAGNVVTLWALS